MESTPYAHDALRVGGVNGVTQNDPQGKLIDFSSVAPQDLEEISSLMQALGHLREMEKAVAEASAKYMGLNETDMRALRYIMVCENQNTVVTARDISKFLSVSAASTTKLLDRLEHGGHIARQPHPSDRRALQINVTPETRRAAYETVGKHQARRFHAAARLTSREREVVTRFLKDMTQEIDLAHADWGNND